MKCLSLTLALIVTLTCCTKKGDMKHCDEKRNPIKKYTELELKTMLELEKAREATIRYNSLENAINDGYEDIDVNVEGMGHHYMKKSLLDDKFDLIHPEILVYNRREGGAHYLVAIEYAIPIDKPEPGGYIGDKDVWTASAEFQLWLLHAWVWEYNPDGVFNPTNPLIHLH